MRIVSRSQIVSLLEDVKLGKVSVEEAEKRITISLKCCSLDLAEWIESKAKDIRDANRIE